MKKHLFFCIFLLLCTTQTYADEIRFTCKDLKGYSTGVNGEITEDKLNAIYIFTLNDQGAFHTLVPTFKFQKFLDDAQVPKNLQDFDNVKVPFKFDEVDGSITFVDIVTGTMGEQIKYFTIYPPSFKVIHTRHSINNSLSVKGGVYTGECYPEKH